MNEQDADQRSYRRFPVNVDCTLTLSNSHCYQGKADNISFGGLFLTLPKTPKDKEQHQPGRFALTTRLFRRVIVVTGQCQIVETDANGFRLHFLAIDTENAQQLLELITELST